MCVSVWLTCLSVCECLYILLFMNMALPDTLQQKATNFLYTTVHYEHMSISLSLSLSLHISFSVRPFVCPSVSVFFYMTMVACKSKEFRFCLPAFTTLSLSLNLCLYCLLCFSLGLWLSPWPVVKTYAVGQWDDHKSQE